MYTGKEERLKESDSEGTPNLLPKSCPISDPTSFTPPNPRFNSSVNMSPGTFSERGTDTRIRGRSNREWSPMTFSEDGVRTEV